MLPRGPLNPLTPDSGRQWGSNAAFDSESCACCSIDGDFHSKAPCRCVCHRAGPSSAVWLAPGAAEMDENDSMPDWTSGDALRGGSYNTPYYDDEAAAIAAMASRAAAANHVVQCMRSWTVGAEVQPLDANGARWWFSVGMRPEPASTIVYPSNTPGRKRVSEGPLDADYTNADHAAVMRGPIG